MLYWIENFKYFQKLGKARAFLASENTSSHDAAAYWLYNCVHRLPIIINQYDLTGITAHIRYLFMLLPHILTSSTFKLYWI